MAETTIESYLKALPVDRVGPFKVLCQTINDNLPAGFSYQITYGMPGWVVPHSTYPAGYHCKPELPLPFMSMASQKHFIALYHMGIYSDPELLAWFQDEWKKRDCGRLDLGKSCIRMKKWDRMPLDLFAELARKLSPNDWVSHYDRVLKK